MTVDKTAQLMLVRQLHLFIQAKGLLCCGSQIHNAPMSDLKNFYQLRTHSLDLSPGIYTNQCHTHSSMSNLQDLLPPDNTLSLFSVPVLCVIEFVESHTPHQILLHFLHQDPRCPPVYLHWCRFYQIIYVPYAGNNVKVYLHLFTCTTTCAVNLEIVQDLTAESFPLTFCKSAAR